MLQMELLSFYYIFSLWLVQYEPKKRKHQHVTVDAFFMCPRRGLGFSHYFHRLLNVRGLLCHLIRSSFRTYVFNESASRWWVLAHPLTDLAPYSPVSFSFNVVSTQLSSSLKQPRLSPNKAPGFCAPTRKLFLQSTVFLRRQTAFPHSGGC